MEEIEKFKKIARESMMIYEEFFLNKKNQKDVHYVLSCLLSLSVDGLFENEELSEKFIFIDNISQAVKIFLRAKDDIEKYNPGEKH